MPTSKAHISADLPWMHHWLGLDWYDKCLIDVEAAEQTLDENAELGLERCALKYTDKGRYDLPLEEWKADGNKDKVTDDLGYLLAPDEILIPYGYCDVTVPMIAAPQIMRRLILDKTWNYYIHFRNHLVTDIFTLFTLFTLKGLPIKMAKIDSLRELYTYCRALLEAKFKAEVQEEARQLFFKRMMSVAWGGEFAQVYQDILRDISEGGRTEAIADEDAACTVTTGARATVPASAFFHSL